MPTVGFNHPPIYLEARLLVWWGGGNLFAFIATGQRPNRRSPFRVTPFPFIRRQFISPCRTIACLPHHITRNLGCLHVADFCPSIHDEYLICRQMSVCPRQAILLELLRTRVLLAWSDDFPYQGDSLLTDLTHITHYGKAYPAQRSPC